MKHSCSNCLVLDCTWLCTSAVLGSTSRNCYIFCTFLLHSTMVMNDSIAMLIFVTLAKTTFTIGSTVMYL